MTFQEFVKTRNFKILLPIFIFAMVLALWKEGYAFGQWLYEMLNK